jgi:hypothetical protein
MADYSVKGGADKDSRGVVLNYILPFIFGGLITLFFFEFVPNMISLAHDDIPWGVAFPKGLKMTLQPFEWFFTSPQPPSVMIFAWPVVGGALGIYINRLFFKG